MLVNRCVSRNRGMFARDSSSMCSSSSVSASKAGVVLRWIFVAKATQRAWQKKTVRMRRPRPGMLLLKYSPWWYTSVRPSGSVWKPKLVTMSHMVRPKHTSWKRSRLLNHGGRSSSSSSEKTMDTRSVPGMPWVCTVPSSSKVPPRIISCCMNGRMQKSSMKFSPP